MTTLGERIKERRKLLHVTQEQLADIAGISINTLTKIERNEGNPTLNVLNKVLDALGLQLNVVVKSYPE